MTLNALSAVEGVTGAYRAQSRYATTYRKRWSNLLYFYMKQYILLFGILFIGAIVLISCNKAEQKTNGKQDNSGTLNGKWELRVLHGGMAVNPSGPNYPPGNGDMWRFTDSLYERYANGQIVVSGKYSLTKDTSQATGKYMDAFILQQDFPYKIFFEFSNDSLVMYNGMIAADGTITKYVRVENQ